MDDFEPQEYWESLNKFADHMPSCEQKDLSILKGHLLIEEQLNRLIEARLRNPVELSKAKLTFYQKLYLAKSFDLNDRESDWVWIAIEKLNKIRNSLAHSLIDGGMEDRIEDFIQFVKNNLDVPSQDDQTDEIGILNMAIFSVYHTISFDIV